jgi:fluoroquinolone transport system permease protein
MRLIKSKLLLNSFRQYLTQITKDAMLFMAVLAPILMGVFIRFGIPYAEKLLTLRFNHTAILAPYYLIFDLFLAVMTPLMYCFISAMVVLGEIDDRITRYLAVTPLGKIGYLISRMGIPMIIAFCITLITLKLFSLTTLPAGIQTGISVLASLSGLITALLTIALSTNKVEGMAVTKLTGILAFGIPVPFFLNDKTQYLLSPLPTFWIAKYAISHKLINIIFGLCVSILWIYLLWRRFGRKLR